MVCKGVALASLAFASSALASGVHYAMGGMMAPRATVLETRFEDEVDDSLRRRQTTAADMNLTQWNTDTSAACESALSSLNAATNPSGTAVCYNLFSLDTNAGTFMADLRLFQVSTPSGDFQSIPPQEISVGLQYSGASVSPVNSTNQTASTVGKRQSSGPTALQTYMFIGQIDKSQMTEPMTMGVLEALVMPTVTLTGKSPTGQQVSTNVSSNEAAFVNGVFANTVVMSDVSLASLAVDDEVAGLHNGTVAFVLPGVNILIFPVGLILTSIWLVVGVAFYAFGTYERYNYRDMYRSRKARDGKPGYAGRI
ncbi:uncharacterized protein F4807DRAFT_243433 [Annulohypoxylon truncatum]|uniref:uncharacterized protein n=1 Tax=Annulohypoxylon truncatum TaxID=327061 RepID=UPI002008B43C|nr:uncharacterized protein F4807DRAFT_243433 [Annulohypoxylon truncatum]KAI1206043.1 hypothetical protein F4807DRAFT_243433 [Annulohypoxylon truncatum]